MAAHAKLGASSSDRWMSCPGSVRLTENMPNQSSSYAQEGSCAHALAELCFETDTDAEDHLGEPLKGFEDIEVNENMTEAVQRYLDVVRDDWENSSEDSELAIEQKFDLSHIYPNMFGTNDACIYDPVAKKLTVYDYKHGQGIAVEAEENPQMLYYAIGALTGKHNRPVKQVELVIVQPRCPHSKGPVRRWLTTPAYMLEHIADLRDAARATADPEAKFAVGDWCKFCPAAKGDCAALNSYVDEAAKAEFAIDGSTIVSDPKKMTVEELGLLASKAHIIQDWARNVLGRAHAEAEAGNCPTGWKLVRKTGHRKFHSPERTIETFATLGIPEAEITEPGKLMSPAKAEKVAKKKKIPIEKIKDLWYTPEIGTALVPDTDDRKAAKPTLAQEFGAVNLF